MNNKNKIIRERLYPKIWQWGYLVLKPLQKELTKFAKTLKSEEVRSILDQGCGQKPYQELFPFVKKYIGFDISKDSEADFTGVNWNLPFKDDEFDALISTQVLEHTKKTPESINEIQRVVKNNGLIFVSLPLAFPEHGAPYDYYRFTQYGIKEIFKDFEIMKIIPQGGYINTIMRFINIFIGSFPIPHLLLSPIFLLNNVTALLSDKFFKVLKNLIPRFKPFYKTIYMGFPENYIVVIRNKK